MLHKSLRFRNLLAISSVAYSAVSFLAIIGYRVGGSLDRGSIVWFSAAGAIFLVLVNLIIGQVGAKGFRADFSALQSDDAKYKQALVVLGQTPLKALILFILISVPHAFACGFGPAAGLSGNMRVVFFTFQLSLAFLAAGFLYVLSDQLVMFHLRDSRLTRYPLDYLYRRQDTKSLIIPLFMSIMTLLFSVTLATMVSEKSGPGGLVFAKIGFLLPLAMYFPVIATLVYLWMRANRVIYSSLISQLGKLNSGEKDLTGRLAVMSVDELGLISGLINEFCAGLQRSVSELKGAQRNLSALGEDLQGNAEASASAIGQIASSVERVVDRVTGQSASVIESSSAVTQIAKNIESMDSLIAEQFSSVTQASSSIEEMVANIGAITSSVEKMAARYSDLTSAAGVGEKAQAGSAERIRQISERSQALLEANKVVATIASQTNLLAMNAAIEAAHAGDAGRGFSVVADEIRRLAETSANQSKTIKKEISEVQRSIEEVVKASANSSDAFSSVARLIDEMDGIVRETHSALVEQREGSMQVLQALQSMNSITTQVRDGSREMSAGNTTVLEEIGRLQENTVSIKDSMDQMSAGAKDIRGHATKVAELARGTRETIETVDAAIGAFKT